MKSIFIHFALLLLSLSAFANGPEVTASVEEILAAKRAVISPVTYRGLKIAATSPKDAPNKVCRALGFSRAEYFETDKFHGDPQYVRITENGFTIYAMGWGDYISSLVCTK